jgi:hypothetical protein
MLWMSFILKTGALTQPPASLHNATVYSKGNFWICTSHCIAIPQYTEQGTDLCEYLLSSHELRNGVLKSYNKRIMEGLLLNY